MRTMTIFCLLSALTAAGCSGAGRPVVHPVRGKVLYDGKPAAGVQVTFYPTTAPGVPDIPSNPRAVTGADGSFELTTFKDGDGAAEGKYMVILNWPAGRKSEHDEEADSDRLFGWYDAAHTKLTARVSAGDNLVPAFRVDRVYAPPPVSEGVPGRN